MTDFILNYKESKLLIEVLFIDSVCMLDETNNPSKIFCSEPKERQCEKKSICPKKSPWHNPKIVDFKVKLKDYLLKKTNNTCSYCQSDISVSHRMTIDIEHILPKSEFKKYSFALDNLSISCRRCNFPPYKGTKQGFTTINYTGTDYERSHFKSENYKFIHPNLDRTEDHLVVLHAQIGKKYVRKYWIINDSEKGTFTVDFFNLRGLETEIIDDAQEIKTALDSYFSALIPTKI